MQFEFLRRKLSTCLVGLTFFANVSGNSAEEIAAAPPDYPPHTKVLEGFEKVVTKANIRPMYTLWIREKDSQVYAELPPSFADKKYFIAMTIASGEEYAGLQSSDLYVYWRRYDKRLALISPNVNVRAVGDREAQSSVKRLFTDRVLLDIPIITMGPGGGPVIDMDDMLLDEQHSSVFFNGEIHTNPNRTHNKVFSIATAKAFENNIEVAFEVPTQSAYWWNANGNGVLKKLHFSISEIPDRTGYEPRIADTRVGYFTTTYTDLAKYNDRETAIRYINRWNLEKADPKLKLSPPKRPIEFIVEHTTPIRYRRWVREGVLAWNKAFEKVGISDAIVVLLQDEVTKQHMDKDPEDVNYNFIRWLNNDIGTAIGPSRVHPLTGEILDADIILTDGWIRHYQKEFTESLPKVAMEGFGPDTLQWLARHPQWDPRMRLANPARRNQIAQEIARQAAGAQAGHPLAHASAMMTGTSEYDGLMGRHSQINGMCLAADGMSFDMALMRMTVDLLNTQTDAAAAATDPTIEGSWTGTVNGTKAAGFPVDQLNFSMSVTSENGALAGVFNVLEEKLPLENPTFDKTTQEFRTTMTLHGGVPVTVTAKVAGNMLTGAWEATSGGQTLKGDLTAMRTPVDTSVAAAPAASTEKPADGKDASDGAVAADKKDATKTPGEQMLDGMPESFVGPLIAHLVAHEVGHTLGLRHNFKASSILKLSEINSDDVKGKKQLAGSVMDYLGTNISLNSGTVQGDYCMTGIGPYDMWAIEYGYTFDDLKPVLARVAEPELVYGTDEDTFGPDPLARRYDFSSEPLDYAENQLRLAKHHRDRLLSSFMVDGDSWDRVRYGYELTLSLQMRSLSMMSGWVGGAFVNRDKKGDPNGRKPIEVVSADRQRKAMLFVVNNAFSDAAFGLTPELVTAMGLDKWSDKEWTMYEDATWPIHDRIMGIQASILTRLMNPTTLQRVYDNEFRVPADQDMLTLPELLSTISDSIWTELDGKFDGAYSARKPLISSLRRNIQREHLERLIDLTLPSSDSSAASRTISMLASERLRNIVTKIGAAEAAGKDRLDQYTLAHMAQARERIQKALDADYILNPSSGGGNPFSFFMLGNQPPGAAIPVTPVPQQQQPTQQPPQSEP